MNILEKIDDKLNKKVINEVRASGLMKFDEFQKQILDLKKIKKTQIEKLIGEKIVSKTLDGVKVSSGRVVVVFDIKTEDGYKIQKGFYVDKNGTLSVTNA